MKHESPFSYNVFRKDNFFWFLSFFRYIRSCNHKLTVWWVCVVERKWGLWLFDFQFCKAAEADAVPVAVEEEEEEEVGFHHFFPRKFTISETLQQGPWLRESEEFLCRSFNSYPIAIKYIHTFFIKYIHLQIGFPENCIMSSCVTPNMYHDSNPVVLLHCFDRFVARAINFILQILLLFRHLF